MKLRPMVIDDAVMADIAKLIAHAEAHRFTLYALKKIMEGVDKPPGDLDAFRIWVPVGYRVVFTLEQHKRERWFRHLSVSVTAKHKYPNEVAILELMKLFGFRGGFEDSLVRDEDLGQGMHAINVLQPEKEE